MAEDQTIERNPRTQHPQPKFPHQHQDMPGAENQMTPRPDHGESSYRGSGKLKDRVAIITGGDSGIGKAVAIAFAREGADVLISYLNEKEDAEDSVRHVQQAGRKALAIAGDIRDEAHCRKIIDEAVREFGRIDILVNNAATQTLYDSILDIPAEDFARTFETNLYSMFYLCKAAVPHMQPGSTIINTTSIQAYQPSPTLLPYASTKGAISTFTKALAQELVKKGIRVNMVAPGPVWTPLIPGSFPEDQVAKFGSSNPMERPAQPVEVAPAYVYLASQDSSFVVGEVIGVTGGKLLP